MQTRARVDAALSPGQEAAWVAALCRDFEGWAQAIPSLVNSAAADASLPQDLDTLRSAIEGAFLAPGCSAGAGGVFASLDQSISVLLRDWIADSGRRALQRLAPLALPPQAQSPPATPRSGGSGGTGATGALSPVVPIVPTMYAEPGSPHGSNRSFLSECFGGGGGSGGSGGGAGGAAPSRRSSGGSGRYKVAAAAAIAALAEGGGGGGSGRHGVPDPWSARPPLSPGRSGRHARNSSGGASTPASALRRSSGGGSGPHSVYRFTHGADEQPQQQQQGAAGFGDDAATPGSAAPYGGGPSAASTPAAAAHGDGRDRGGFTPLPSPAGGAPSAPDALQALLGGVASLLQKQGRLGEAAPLLRDRLTILSASQGPSHPDALAAAEQLACALLSMGQYEEAEGLLGESLRGSREALGETHERTLACAVALAELLRKRGRFKARCCSKRDRQTPPPRRSRKPVITGCIKI